MRYRKQRKKNFIPILLCTAAVVCAVLYANGFLRSAAPAPSDTGQTATTSVKPSTTAASTATAMPGHAPAATLRIKDMPAPTSPTTHLPAADITDTGLLVLVNKDYAVQNEPTKASLAHAYHVVPIRIADMYLHPEALDALAAMFDEAERAGLHNLVFSSGFRDYADQKQTYDNATNKALVQPPGHSEHQTGLAADIFALGVTEENMANSVEGKWLAANAWRFGFILRYPADKEEITGIHYEPWHFRYVGAPHAAYCYENNLCLEEYIALLQTSGGYTAAIDSVTYNIIYVTPANGTIPVPETDLFHISANNTGGYIITAWE